MSLQVELQYFNVCPDSGELLKRVRSAVEAVRFPVEFLETLVETPEAAINTRFRGSPTLLINGEDYTGLPEPKNAYLACRIYEDGIPSTAQIISRLQEHRP